MSANSEERSREQYDRREAMLVFYEEPGRCRTMQCVGERFGVHRCVASMRIQRARRARDWKRMYPSKEPML